MDRPNILLIVADQVTPFLTSAYGDSAARMPSIDTLAADGVTFDSAYTPFPLCSPARASLMTGRDASDIGCLDNASVMPADVPTIGHYLTNVGYDTVLSGKMHFIGPDQQHGFGRRLTTDVFPAGVDWVPTIDEDGSFPGGGQARHYTSPDPGVRTWTQFMAYDEETQFRALEYVRERGRLERSDPFCLVVSYHHPHDPFHVSQEMWDLYDDVDIPIPDYPENLEATYSIMDRWANDAHGTSRYDLRAPESLRQLRRAYYASLSFVDRKIGELLDALKRSGELDKTVVIFTSDHGDMLGERGMVQKRCFYEWSARIPLIIRLPRGAYAGNRISIPVSLIDVLPTVLDLAQAQDRAPSDGISMLPLITGQGENGERVVFSEYHLEKVHAPCFMVRSGRFKYIYIHSSTNSIAESLLFDLEADPGEWINLSDQTEYTGIKNEMHTLLLNRFDPDLLAAQDALSLIRRKIIKDAMARNDTHWDYSPQFDASRQYVR